MDPSQRHFARPLARLLGLALLAAGAYLSASSTPRLTWLNSGLSIDYSAGAASWAMLAALGARLAALGLARGPRSAAVATALIALAFAMHLTRYRVTIEDAGLSERGLLGTKALAWKDVARVESGSRLVVVWGRDDEQVRIDASPFAAADRARLDRTIARRVREGAPPGR